jgi:tripartite-type tricarboxylate transporter receptor subunit TctC
MMTIRWILSALLTCACGAAFAQGAAFPAKPLTIIVPYAGGSGSDIQARLFGQHLATALGQSVVVENRPGANGAVGMQALKAAPADGYTLALGGGSVMVINPLLTKNLGYEAKDFIAVSGVAKSGAGFVVGANSPFRTLEDALAAANRDKRALNVGTYAAFYELGAAWLGALSNTKVANVAYKGAAQVANDLMGGHLEMGFIDMSGVVALVKSGKLRVVALTAEQRNPLYPGVPLVKDKFPEYVANTWTALLVRTDTPPAVVAKLSSALQGLFSLPEIREYYEKSGFEPLNLTAEQMQAFQQQEAIRARGMADAARIEPR